MHGANCKYHWLIIIPGLIYNTRKKSGLNVTSAEILYGNDLIFDFCCISRCSGEMLLTKASPCKPLQTKLASRCASLLWYTWFARFTTFLPYPLPRADPTWPWSSRMWPTCPVGNIFVAATKDTHDTWRSAMEGILTHICNQASSQLEPKLFSNHTFVCWPIDDLQGHHKVWRIDSRTTSQPNAGAPLSNRMYFSYAIALLRYAKSIGD